MKTRKNKGNRKEEELSAESSVARNVSDTPLIREAQGGDMAAFEELVEKYDRHVLSLAFSYARNSDDAKDIYQETLIRAYRSISKFELRSEFSTWLYRIATNVCISFKSSQKKYVDMFKGGSPAASGERAVEPRGDPPSSLSTEGEFFRAELGREIERALDNLSPMQRLVFTMKHYEGYKLREIAAITKCAEGTVKKHLYEAVRRLQNELEEAVR
jgi:RNA polymerase sigma-70 factor, ECF subfamily